MTSLRQIAANRRNAERSTGPRTEGGKRRSRRNALRHGLCAETVIEILEDVDDYKAFEIAIASEYDARSVVERELVLRLASLLWRIRRATAIETALLRIQAEGLPDPSPAFEAREDREPPRHGHFHAPETVELGQAWGGADVHRDDHEDFHRDDHEDFMRPFDQPERMLPSLSEASMRDLAHCFQAIAETHSGLFDRLRRYEASLWRQIAQTLFALQAARRRFGPVLGNR